MTQAFDIKDLVMRLEGKGMPVVEEVAQVLAGEVLDWLQDSMAMSSVFGLPMLAPLVASVKPFVMKEIDKIDGKEG